MADYAPSVELSDRLAARLPGFDPSAVRFVVRLPWFAKFSAVPPLALAWRATVHLHPAALADAAGLEGLLLHELVHLRQQRRDGLIRFALRYAGDYLRGRFRGLSRDAAYRAIRYEVEAREISGAG